MLPQALRCPEHWLRWIPAPSWSKELWLSCWGIWLGGSSCGTMKSHSSTCLHSSLWAQLKCEPCFAGDYCVVTAPPDSISSKVWIRPWGMLKDSRCLNVFSFPRNTATLSLQWQPWLRYLNLFILFNWTPKPWVEHSSPNTPFNKNYFNTLHGTQQPLTIMKATFLNSHSTKEH